MIPTSAGLRSTQSCWSCSALAVDDKDVIIFLFKIGNGMAQQLANDYDVLIAAQVTKLAKGHYK